MIKIPKELIEAAEHLAKFGYIVNSGWRDCEEQEEKVVFNYTDLCTSFLNMLVRSAEVFNKEQE